MKEITEQEIISEFNNDKDIWPVTDKWHFYTRKKIEEFLMNKKMYIDNSSIIVNAGSSGETYGISDSKTIHIDLFERRIKDKPNKIVCNIQNIPLNEASTDLVLCVGSVVNYSDLIKSISEFSRITKTEGILILEFECSNTLELLGSDKLSNNVVLRETIYRNEKTKIWYYNSNWVKKNLSLYGYEVIDYLSWHYVSPLILKLTRNTNFSAFFARYDNFFKSVPFFKNYYSNAIVIARKINSI